MSDQIQKTAWGFQNDNDESLKTKQGGKFGLNASFITKFEYNGLAGKDETAADAIDITVKVGEKEYRSRIYDITGDLFKGDSKLSPGEEGYAELYNAEKKQREAVVIHTVKAFGTTEDQIKAALQNGNVVDFKSWAIAMCGTKPADFATKPVDSFLEYQWNIQEGNERTFLQLPKNMKGGRFLTPHVAPVGAWEEVNDAEGLRYVDSAKNEHPFSRDANFMGSNKAKLQVEGEDAVSAVAGAAGTGEAIAGTSATKSKW
jgi:hypothetical protein